MTTLLQALVRYAATSETITPPYFAEATYHWQLDLQPNGRPTSPELTPLTSTVFTARGAATKPWLKRVTPRVVRSSGISPMLASDDIAYVLGWADGATSKQAADVRHAAYVKQIVDWVDFADGRDRFPGAILEFLRTHLGAVEKPAKWTARDGLLLTIEGVHPHDSSTAREYWTERKKAQFAAGRGPCLVCARTGQLVKSFPQKIVGNLTPGGHTSGVSPVSVNAAVFGFGLQEGLEHVPVCEDCANAIPAALNDLLSDIQRTRRDEVAATTWWVDGGSTFDPVTLTGTADESEVSTFVRAVKAGRLGVGGFDPGQFYSVTVSGNSPRLVVHRWKHLPVAQLKQYVAEWFLDIEVEPRYADGRRYHSLVALAQCTGRHDGSRYLGLSDRAGRHPHGIAQILERSAFGGEAIPPAVLAHLLQRICADRHIDDSRVSFLRLALNRSPLTTEAVMPGLDPENTSTCYVLGRLFAVYEGLQIAAARADGGTAPNATFADKHLSGAISSPQLVLTAGERQSAAWLAKLRRSGKDHFHRRDIDEIIALLDPAMPPPSRATTDEQALFVVGYHHQRGATQRRIDEAKAAKSHTHESDH